MAQIVLDFENAETLNFEKVNQTAFDPRNLQLLKKPGHPLVFPTPFSPLEPLGLDIAGSNTHAKLPATVATHRPEFKDLFEHVWTPLAFQDMQTYLKEMQVAALKGYTELNHLQSDIERLACTFPLDFFKRVLNY
jgi:hypothetical protein